MLEPDAKPGSFRAVAQDVDLPAMEERVLQRWRDRDVFRTSLERTADGPLYRFYEGPPTANGAPGVHHVEARVFKDILPRYRTMKGHHVLRKGGWDCHGIPVELEVERELGFNSKPEIERYGVAEFNARCRESVTGYVKQFDDLTERIGYWVDTDDAYWTMSTEYVESVWWSLKTLFERGFVYADNRVVPYCPRCGTALSDHEVAQGYKDTEDPSIYVRLPVLDGPLAEEGADLLVWTTMPWTFIPTTLAVVGPEIRYVLARGGKAGDRPVVIAADLLEDALGEDAEAIRDVALDELVGAHYEGPFDYVGPGSLSDPDGDRSTWRFVVADEYVKTDEGTGLVSTAPGFGEDDMRVARAYGLPEINPLDSQGRFDERVGPFAGVFVRDADPLVIEALEERGVLVRSERLVHTFPFCWRCDSPLIYYAKPCWYIATTRVRDRLQEENAKVDWRPPHIRDGRYGDWIANNVDWALSRDRYWGTPLPFWRCEGCEHTVAVGSLAELSELAGSDLSELDPHRPHVDAVELECTACGKGRMKRIPSVIDAWYDSGAMPFAQFGYPHREGSEARFEELFPADYVCEAIDQTRGWFYSLHAIATLLFDRNSYRHVLCLGHIVDAKGRKMSKTANNVRDPWELIGAYGADTLRWLLLVEGNPWQPRRVDDDRLKEVTRKLFVTIWNIYYFFVTYANMAEWRPSGEDPPVAERPVMDRYILAELVDASREIDAAFANSDVTKAGRRLREFAENLSNWYLRRSRDRFSEPDDDAAFATLYTCLTNLAGLLAPFAPFIADELYEGLVREADPNALASVHLTEFPTGEEADRDDELRETMAVARKLVTLGREARASAGVPLRQPLRQAALIMPPEVGGLPLEISGVVAGELNVKEIKWADESGGDAVTLTLKPNYRALGPLFGNRTPAVAAAIEALDPEPAIEALRGSGSFAIEVNGDEVAVGPEGVDLVEKPITGWQVSTEGSYGVALDTTIDRDLRLEGMARIVVRTVNDLRKRGGLSLDERIALEVVINDDPDGDIAAMFETHKDWIIRETSAAAVRFANGEGEEGESVSIAGGNLFVNYTILGG